MRIGILGGTFDPVHLGHIKMAEEARDALGLAEVIMVPTGNPVSRANLPVASAEHRLSMLGLAVEDKPGLAVSRIEIERPGPTFTVDTISALKNKYGRRADLYFILGWDSLEQLPQWHEPARLITMCRLVAVPRPGCPRPDLKVLEHDLPGITKKVIFLEKPYVDISATAVRGMVARGEPIEGLVPPVVAEYIEKHRSYRAEGGRS